MYRLDTKLTIDSFFKGIVQSFSRFELPGVYGFNFLLKNALGGGGVASLRSDPQVRQGLVFTTAACDIVSEILFYVGNVM